MRLCKGLHLLYSGGHSEKFGCMAHVVSDILEDHEIFSGISAPRFRVSALLCISLYSKVRLFFCVLTPPDDSRIETGKPPMEIL